MPLSALCPPVTPSPGCRVTIELRTIGRGAHRVGIMVGRATTLVAPGKDRSITIALSRLGRRLLRRHSPLPLIATTVMATASAARSKTATASTTPSSTTPSTSATASTSATVQCRPTGPPVLPAAGPGPTAVVGGIYIVGGAVNPVGCAGHAGPTPASAGTVEVIDAAGNVAATQTVAADQTFTIAVPPGTYTLRGGPANFCRSNGPVTVTEGNQAPVEVVCDVP